MTCSRTARCRSWWWCSAIWQWGMVWSSWINKVRVLCRTPLRSGWLRGRSDNDTRCWRSIVVRIIIIVVSRSLLWRWRRRRGSPGYFYRPTCLRRWLTGQRRWASRCRWDGWRKRGWRLMRWRPDRRSILEAGLTLMRLQGVLMRHGRCNIRVVVTLVFRDFFFHILLLLIIIVVVVLLRHQPCWGKRPTVVAGGGTA